MFYRHYTLLVLSLALGVCADIRAQTHTISGIISDQESGERLIGASVFSPDEGRGTVTNEQGYFIYHAYQESVRLRISFVGYRDTVLVALSAAPMHIRLVRNRTELGMVEIAANATEQQLGKLVLTPEAYAHLPYILGERDILKALQLQAGMSHGMEGTAGLYARGSGPEHNTILLDGAPVYNVYHLFGLLSVFNDRAIKSVSAFTGAIPARYGGQIGSVLDLRTRDGDADSYHAVLDIGLLSSAAQVEGPLRKGIGSFIVSGRRTYADLPIRAFQRLTSAPSDIGYYFGDLHGKVNGKLGPRTRVFASGYLGSDHLSAKGFDVSETEENRNRLTSLRWTNRTASLQAYHYSRRGLFVTAGLNGSRYDLDTTLRDYGDTRESPSAEYEYASGIAGYAATLDAEYSPARRLNLEVGAAWRTFSITPETYHIFRTSEEGADLRERYGLSAENRSDFSAYLEAEISLSRALTFLPAVRLETYQPDRRLHVQPRLSVRAALGAHHAQIAYSASSQNLHLITNGGIYLPTERWAPAMPGHPTATSRQLDAGMSGPLFSDRVQYRLEGYYRTMRNMLSIKEGASFFDTGSYWYNNVQQTEGKAYGADLSLRRPGRRLSLEAAYSLSWSWRRLPGSALRSWFPYAFDRRHHLSTIASVNLSGRRTASLAWEYLSGLPISLPTLRTVLEDSGDPTEMLERELAYYGLPNQERLRPYHRMDFSYRVRYGHTHKPRFLTLGAYNAYSRMNTLYVEKEYVREGNVSRPVYYEHGILPVIPFVSYSITLR